MMHVRPSFVREAALLLADLAGGAGRPEVVASEGFVDALIQALDHQQDGSGTSQRWTAQPTSPSAPFLAQLQGEGLLPPELSTAINAYSQRLVENVRFEGPQWPLDLNV